MNLPPLQRNRIGTYNIVLYDTDGSRQNLANCSVTMYFKTAKNHTDAQAHATYTIGSGLTIVSTPDGELQLQIPAADTASLDWSSGTTQLLLYFSTVLQDSSGKDWPPQGGAGILPVVTQASN